MLKRPFVFFVFAAPCVFLACSSGGAKEKKCKEVFNTTVKMGMEIARAMGGKLGGAREATPEIGESFFVNLCKELPDDAVDCMDMKYMLANAPKCGEVMAKLDKGKFGALFQGMGR
ncbi:MAG: hypothetical protein HYY84_19030 [Deltaproteobacteria bacterium]|nr:hypothetical protein [Deltaproteobacteria bacterium]